MSAIVTSESNPSLVTLSIRLADAAERFYHGPGNVVLQPFDALHRAIFEMRNYLAGIDVKDGRVLASTNYKKLKDAHGMIAEVIAAHDASRPVDPTLPETPGQVPHAPTKSLAEEIADAVGALTTPTEAEAWFDGAFARDLAARLAVHPSNGAAGR